MSALEPPHSLNQFSWISCISSKTSSIKCTHNISPVSVEFVDIQASIKHGKFTTSIFYKPTDAHAYLYFHSSP